MKPRSIVATVTLLLVSAIVGSVLAYGKPSVSANQITFQGNGSGTFNSQQMPFSVSVQCYGSSCVGALAFPGSSTPSPTAAIYVTGTVTQLQQDSYMMSVSSRQPPAGTLPPTSASSVSCSLANTPPVVTGEANTVSMSCSSPVGTGVSHDAIVVVPSADN